MQDKSKLFPLPEPPALTEEQLDMILELYELDSEGVIIAGPAMVTLFELPEE